MNNIASKNSTNGNINPNPGTIDNGEPVEQTDMAKVNYYLNRPGLLINMLPAREREALSAHVGRRVQGAPLPSSLPPKAASKAPSKA